MKLTFHVTLLTLLLGLVLFTVLGLGLSSWYNARNSADDLSGQVLDQTSQRIDERLRSLLAAPASETEVNRRLLQSGPIDLNDFPALAASWVEVMRARPELTRLSVGLEESGEWLYVRRVAAPGAEHEIA